MPLLNPFMMPTAGSPQAIVAPNKRRRKKMVDPEFYQSQQQAPQNVKVMGSSSGAQPGQEYQEAPQTGDHLAELLSKVKNRTAPPALTPGSRVRNPNTDMVKAGNFQSYYDQMGLLRQMDTDRTAASAARALYQRNQAMQNISNTNVPAPGGGIQTNSSGGTAGQLKYQGSGNVLAWISQAADILAQNGISLSPQDRQHIAIMIQHESGGNPNAINLWDSNAKKGIPSKGLMQTIDPTFNSYKLPGYNDIYNPVHNIIAGVRYSLRNYKSLSNVPGIRNLNSGRGGYVGY